MTNEIPAVPPVHEMPKAPIGLKLIAAAKIAKGAAFAGLALGVFGLVHKNLEDVARHFVQVFRISPENHYVELLLVKLGVVEPATLRRLGELTALDASIQLVEGLGLWFGAWWAEYLVVISTGLFIPEECLSTFRHFTWVRLTILILNLAMFAYVAQLVLGRHRARGAARAAAKAKAQASNDSATGI
jgi:uncharacterized membrane protein (DUF2068 family)